MGKRSKRKRVSALKKALKNRYSVMFYTDEEGRRRAIKLQEEKARRNVQAFLEALEEQMMAEGIRPANDGSSPDHVVEVVKDGKVYRYEYDPNKVSKDEAKEQIKTYLSLAIKAAEIGSMLLA